MLRRLSAVLFCAGVLGLESKAASLVFYPAQAGVSTALSGVAYNPDMDRFVAVGTNLVTLMSPESSSLRPSSIWSENLVSTNGPLFRGLSPSALSRVGLRSVVYGNGVFVAGGRNGIFVSSNGVDWANQTVFPKLDVTSVALTRSPGTNVTWVATSRSFPIYYNSHPSSSTNFASAWDSAQVKNGLFERWRAVCALDGSNMAVCGVGGTIRTSSNSGRTWKTIKGRLFGSGPNLNAIAWGDDKLVAVGDREQILLSTNRGANWSIVEKAKGKGTPKLNAVAYSKGGFFAVGDRGLIRFSPDGRNWSTPPVFPAVTDNLTGVALNTDGSVAVIVTGNQTILMGSERPTAVVSLVGTNKPCNGDTNTIQAVLTGNGPWSGNWSDGVPFTSSTDILTRLVTFTNTMAIGSTTVTYTVTNLVDSKELSGTNLTGSAVITVNSTVRANAGTNKNICAEEMAALGGSPTASGGTGPYTYSWSPANYLDNSTNANPVATPPPGSSTIYTVTVTDSLGCSASSNVTVVVSPTLTANAGNNTNICPGKMATLGGSPTASGGAGGYTYSWSPANYLDDATSANPVAAPPANSTITYTVTVTDASNCMASSTVTVRVFLELTATAGMPANVCAGSKVMLGGSPTASGGTGFYTYSWSPTNYLDNPTSANPVLSNAPPGFTTNYTVTVIDASNCTATASITVRVSTLGANAGISRINCSDTNLLILGGLGGTTTASGGTSPYTYSWSPTAFFVDVNDARNANPRVNLPPGTSMTYSLTVTDSNNCVVTSSVTVGVAAPLMADAGPANRVVCLGPVGLGGSPTASGGVPTYTYSWSPTNYLDNPTIANPTFNPPSQGDYTFTVTVTDTNGCMATATTELSV